MLCDTIVNVAADFCLVKDIHILTSFDQFCSADAGQLWWSDYGQCLAEVVHQVWSQFLLDSCLIVLCSCEFGRRVGNVWPMFGRFRPIWGMSVKSGPTLEPTLANGDLGRIWTNSGQCLGNFVRLRPNLVLISTKFRFRSNGSAVVSGGVGNTLKAG